MNLKIEESTTERVSHPLHEIVERVLSQSNSLDSMQRDLFFIVIVVLMLENGFLPLDQGTEIKDPATFINLQKLHSWKSTDGIYETYFILSGFNHLPLKLILSPLGATVLVNAKVEGMQEAIYSVGLPISRYVVSPQASTVPMKFRDLKHLSLTFKNKILSPVKSRILSQCGYPSGSLIGLPDELLRKIIMNLPIIDVINVRRSCHRLNNIFDSQDLWHNLFKRDFNTSDGDSANWIELYKHSYKLQQDGIRGRRNHAAGSLHDYMDHSDYMSYVDNPLWDVL